LYISQNNMYSSPDLSLLFKRIELRRPLDQRQKNVLRDAFDRTFIIPAKQEIVGDGEAPQKSTLLLEGFAARSKVTERGGRQITALHVAGDFVDLHSFPLKVMDHSVVAITDCAVATVPHEALSKIVATEPNLTTVLWLLTLLDSAIHREWLVSMGATNAIEHMAHLFCEMFMRLKVVGLTERGRFPLPLVQSELGAALGLSDVHVNRVLQELRGGGLIEFDGKYCVILDWPGLIRLAQFDPAHLHLPGDDVLRQFGPE
jgi:CRP-like cAMP-binding protein